MNIQKRYMNKETQERLHQVFKKNTPFSHIQLNDFLDEKEAYKLYKALLKEKFFEKKSDLFSLYQTGDLSVSENETIHAFSAFISSKAFCDLISSITGVVVSKNKDLFGSLYTSTNFLLCHDDILEGRRIAYLLYLSKGFTKEDGGSLVLYDDVDGNPLKIVKEYIPIFNTLLLFEVSQKSWHEVAEVLSDKKRFAIGGWLH